MAVAPQKNFRRFHAGVAAKRNAVGLRKGFRSGLEEMNANLLDKHGVAYCFEQIKIKYVVPAIERSYKLDFYILHNGIMVETKGLFDDVDRAKHLYIRHQHPDLDIRFVFQRPNTPIKKGSKTTYAAWAEKYGFKWATKTIPLTWLTEPPGKSVGFKPGDEIPVPQEAKDFLIGPARLAHGAHNTEARELSEVAGKAKRPPRRRVPSGN